MEVLFNDNIQKEFHQKGYIIVDMFEEKKISNLYQKSLDMIAEYKSQLPNRYFPVGQLNNFTLRNRSSKLIKDTILDDIYVFFKHKNIKIYAGTHLIKPRGLNSFLPTHQDSSIVDETKFNAILFWCPLHPIHNLNGKLYMVEGSHHFYNPYRSTTIPWRFAKQSKQWYNKAIPLNLKVGQVCFFHAAMIHHSGYNWWSKYRIAVSAFITDSDASLMNYYYNPEINCIESYVVDDDYYHNNDFNESPSIKGYSCIETIPMP